MSGLDNICCIGESTHARLDDGNVHLLIRKVPASKNQKIKHMQSPGLMQLLFRAYLLKSQSRDNLKVAQCAAFLRLALSNLRLVFIYLLIAIVR